MRAALRAGPRVPGQCLLCSQTLTRSGWLPPVLWMGRASPGDLKGDLPRVSSSCFHSAVLPIVPNSEGIWRKEEESQNSISADFITLQPFHAEKGLSASSLWQAVGSQERKGHTHGSLVTPSGQVPQKGTKFFAKVAPTVLPTAVFSAQLELTINIL